MTKIEIEMKRMIKVGPRIMMEGINNCFLNKNLNKLMKTSS